MRALRRRLACDDGGAPRRPLGTVRVKRAGGTAAAFIACGVVVAFVAFSLGATGPATEVLRVDTAGDIDAAEGFADQVAMATEQPGGAAPLPTSYTVEDGDTLLEIAFKFDSSVEALRRANNLANPDFLRIGQEIIVPPALPALQAIDPSLTARDVASSYRVDVPTAPALGASTTYTVVEGDTILGIAAMLDVDADALAAANRLPNSNRIVVGDQLAIPLWDRPARSDEDAPAPGDMTLTAASLPASSLREGEPMAWGALRPMAPTIYEVNPGDTLTDVAWKFGLDVHTLVNNNEVADPDRVKVGDQLTVLPVSGLLYRVQAGDSLAGIAERYKIDLGPIIDFNYLEDANVVRVGTELILPGASPRPPPPPQTPRLPAVYEVSPGDTVLAIAQRFGVAPDDIIEANGLRSADRISVGTSLRIVPGAAARPSPPGVAARPAAQATAAAPQQVTRNLPVPAAAAPAAQPSTPGGGGRIVSAAMPYRGSRYVWGGTTPAGFDCSGFIYYVQNAASKPVPRGMWGQYNAGRHVGRGELQPGDLVFFQNTYMPGLSHNGIYIGNGQFIHASDESSGVTISRLADPYWASRWFGATRAW